MSDDATGCSLVRLERTLAPGETGTLSLIFDQPGAHTFMCSITGHATMTGAVFVSP